MAEHSPVKIALILTTLVVFIVTVVFSSLAGAGTAVFDNSVDDVSDKYALELTPADWTFAIWGVIFAWQAAWLVYTVTTIWRRIDGTYLYQLPAYPAVVFALFIVNNAFVLGWIFAWDNEEIAVSLALIFLATVLIWSCLGYSIDSLSRNLKIMYAKGLNTDVWLIRILVQNGLALYAFWLLTATLLNLGAVLTYKDGGDVTDTAVDADDSTTVVLSILAFIFLVLSITDIILLDNYTRYLVTPYVVLVVVSAGTVDADDFDLDDTRRNSILALVLLIVSGLLLIVKLLVLAYRHKKRPIKPQ